MKINQVVVMVLVTCLLAACGNGATTENDVVTAAPTSLESEPTGVEPTNTPESHATIEASTATGAPSATATIDPSRWQDAPIIPVAISARAVEIYQTGIAMGRNPVAFSKVGDCGGTPSWFLGPFDVGPAYYSLGEHTYLTPVIEYYQGSFERYSVAVSPGFNTSSVLSPFWADPEACAAGEGPLQCEIRVHNPSVALIMLGTNDQFRADEFEEPMRAIIEYTISQGVLPVLSSKADNLEGDGQINEIIYKLALEYELPFWNFWATMQGLPDEGQQVDDPGHLTWAAPYFDKETNMQAGWPHRNLTALQILDLIYETVGAE
jgi:hypothetical protein